MKKIISIITVCLACVLSLTACNTTPTEVTNDFSDVELVKWGTYDRLIFYNSLSDLEEGCDVAVIGTFVEDSTQKLFYQYHDYLEKDIIAGIRSTNTIEVKEVLRGDINVGDTITVGQKYAVVDGQLLTMSDLTPMVRGDTWIFFLFNNYDSGIYYCCGDSDGRYPVPNSDNQVIALTEYSNLGVYDEYNFKRGIYNEILEKYNV